MSVVLRLCELNPQYLMAYSFVGQLYTKETDKKKKKSICDSDAYTVI